MSDEIKTVVTLVHGTFARNASWTRPDSKISTGLSSALPKPVVINQFQWSGKNRFSDRMSASDRLADQIEKTSAELPHARQILVAHSHGGSIIASLSEKAFDSISLAVCLSTPFIHLKKRDDNLLLKFSYFSNFVLGIMLSYITFVVFQSNNIKPKIFLLTSKSNILNSIIPNVKSIFNGGYAIEFLCYTLMFLALMMLITNSIYRFSRNSRSLLETISQLRVSQQSEKLIIMRTVADEASFAISLSHFVSRISSIFYEIPAMLIDDFWKSQKEEMKENKDNEKVENDIFQGKYGCIFAFIFFTTAIYIANILSTNLIGYSPVDVNSHWFLSIVAGIVLFGAALVATGFVLLLVAVILISLVFWPTWLLGAVSGLVLGRELSLCFPFFEATAEATPAGNFRICQLSFDETDGASARLRHSAVYESEAVIKVIEEWISENPDFDKNASVGRG